jgi:predicted GNAT family N-acyltransferase
MKSELKFKKVETIPEFIDAIRIRANVFIKEQGFEPGWEPDEDDKISQHFIGLLKDEIITTARCREMSPGEFKIERMVVKKEHRGKGVGTALCDFIIDNIKKQNPKKIWVRSQVQSQPFYEKCNFKPTSEPFDMYGCMHIDMEWK